MPQINLNNNPGTSFRNIVDTFEKGSAKLKGQNASLRIDTKETGKLLYTKDSGISRWGAKARIDRGKKKLAAREFVEKALNKKLKELGMRETAGTRLLHHLTSEGLVSEKKITVRELKRIDQTITDLEKQAQEISTFKESGLDDFHMGSTRWKMSDAGGRGVIFCEKEGGEKAVLKFEGVSNTKVTSSIYSMLDGMRSNIPVPLPFLVPKFSLINVKEDKNSQEMLERKLNDAAQKKKEEDPNSTRHLKINGETDSMLQSLKKDGLVCKFELVSNGSQLDKIDPKRKVKLLDSPEFAKNVGKSAAIMQFLGLSDHLNLGVEYANCTNMSNLMIDAHDNLHLIDPSMMVSGDLDTPVLGKSTDSMQEIFAGCMDFLKGTEPSLLPERFFENGFEDLKTNPFGNLLGGFLNPEALYGDLTFFSKDEKPILENVPSSTRQKFAARVMDGFLEGLQFLNDNSESLKELSSESHGLDFSHAEVLKTIEEGLKKMNVGEIRKGLQSMMK
ncbi:MAG: hypothetical protein ACO1TE_18180 [Prosthecobacter sp.]